MATLFKRYSQGEASTARRHGGAGLGLAISKTLVELMGGQIGVLSHVGSGSTFWFVLPLEAAAAPSAEAPGPAETTAETTAGDAAAIRESVRLIEPPRLPAPTRLLLVEDNFVNQRVALYMLGKLGYQVDVAQDGREALERLRRGRYRLILMDCQMPEMDGFEATQLIRDPNSGVLDHSVPIIAMTANTFPEDRARSIAAGMNDFLSKPVDQATLSAMLGKWLRPAEAAVEETT
jgi:CheY-like chemotaxis protein